MRQTVLFKIIISSLQWGGNVILVRHNLSIIPPPVEHNFEQNTLVSRVTPESIILYFFEHNPADPRDKALIHVRKYALWRNSIDNVT